VGNFECRPHTRGRRPYDALTRSVPQVDPQVVTEADAWAWLESEHGNLLAAARQQLAADACLPAVRDVALVVGKHLDYGGHFAELAQFGQLALDAADRLGDRAGTALALKHPGRRHDAAAAPG
jgi:hypothetical protein